MDTKLETQLVDKYPILFANVKTLQLCDGWYDLIDRLCEKLSFFPEVEFCQVKQKFGGLRAYINDPSGGINNHTIYAIIRYYEDLSVTTCEVCGESGKLCNPPGYPFAISARCEDHSK